MNISPPLSDEISTKKKVNAFEKKLEEIAKKDNLKKLTKCDKEYGRPVDGSKTQLRGFKAHSHISNEVRQLCEIIRDNGKLENDLIKIYFGQLFQIYTTISNKVVGVLLRARKHGFVQFEGEILFQGKDDGKEISLIQMPPDDLNFTY